MPRCKFLVSLALYIHGSDLDPDVVSQTLGVIPTDSHRRGDRHGREGQLVRKGGMWAVRVSLDTYDLSEISGALAGMVSSVKLDGSAILRISGVQRAYFDVFVVTRYDEERSNDIEYELVGEVVSELGRIGLPVQITNEFVGNCLLSGLAFPRNIEQDDRDLVLRSRVQVECFAMALRQFKADNGFYPTTEQGLYALVKKPSCDPVPENYPPDGYINLGLRR